MCGCCRWLLSVSQLPRIKSQLVPDNNPTTIVKALVELRQVLSLSALVSFICSLFRGVISFTLILVAPLFCCRVSSHRSFVSMPCSVLFVSPAHILISNTTGEPPIQLVIDAGLVQSISILLHTHHEHTDIAKEAMWCMGNLCAFGLVEQVRVVLSLQPIQVLVNYSRCTNVLLREMAIWVLGNIAGSSAEGRDQLLNMDVFLPISEACLNLDSVLGKLGLWVLSNICFVSPAPPEKIVSFCCYTVAALCIIRVVFGCFGLTFAVAARCV